MERIKMGKNLEVSRIIQGFWRATHWNITGNEMLTLIEECLELGIDTFDTADIYMSEELQGKAMSLKPSIRENMKIITKCGIKPKMPLFPGNKTLQYDSSKEHILSSVDNALGRLGIEYIDLLLIHRPDFIMDPEEMAEAFDKLKSSGKVLNFGVSNFKPSQLSMLQSYMKEPLITNQIQISPLHVEPFVDGTLDYCLEKRIIPMAWSPLEGGRIFTEDNERNIRLRSTLEKIKGELGAKSIDEVAYAWLLKHPSKILPIVGSSKIERIKSAVNATKLDFTRDQWYEIWQSSLGRNID